MGVLSELPADHSRAGIRTTGDLLRTIRTVVVVGGVLAVLKWLWQLVAVERHELDIAVFIFFIAAGVGLFALRKHKRHWYGSVELVFAVFAGFESIKKMPEFEGYLAFGAALYVFVRGLDNIDHALQERAKARAEARARAAVALQAALTGTTK